MRLSPLAGAAHSHRLAKMRHFSRTAYTTIPLNVRLTNVAVILEARVLHNVYGCLNLRSLVLRMGQNEPMGSTSLVSCLPSSLNASRSFDTVRFLLTFRSPDGSKTLPTSICMGSRRRLESILRPYVTTKMIEAWLLYRKQERESSLLPSFTML
jgi:hypothetical protein